MKDEELRVESLELRVESLELREVSRSEAGE